MQTDTKTKIPKNSKRINKDKFQDDIQIEKTLVKSGLDNWWIIIKSWSKMIICFVIMPLCVILLSIIWLVVFLVAHWDNWTYIEQFISKLLSYIFIAIISSTITYYIQKN